MASQIFMQVPGVTGESTAAAHVQWIELISCSFGVSAPTAAGAGKTQFDTIIAVKLMDGTSFPLYSYALQGKATDGTLIDIVGAGPGGTTWRIYLKQSLIVRVATEAQGAEAPGQETVQFSCSQIQWSTITALTTGKPVVTYETGWDLIANKLI